MIINATLEVPQFNFHVLFLRVPARDVRDGQLFLNAAHGLHVMMAVHNALVQGKHILVHCFAGASRSVAIVLAYLLWRYRTRSMLSVYEELREKRTIVHVNSDFIQEIQTMLPVWDYHTHQLVVL